MRYVHPRIDRHLDVFVIKPDLMGLVREITKVLSRVKGRALIFTNTRDMAEALGALLRKKSKIRFRVHHSSISRDLRIRTEEELKEGKIKTVIATSSLELGIDVGDIEHVIQINSPRRVEVALQRVGRSGHFITRVSSGTIIAMSIDDLFEALSIAMLAEKGYVEPISLMEKSYDVLAHQIIGIIRDIKFDTNSYPSVEYVFRVVRRAYPYRNLGFDEFIRVCRFLERNSRVLRIENGVLRLSRKSIKQYFENVSMIPHSPKYRVVEAATYRILGELDEQYVLNLDRGSKFILGGQCREVLKINHMAREVVVRRVSEITEPPEWIGELLPVSFMVARIVGRLRRWVFEGKIGGVRRFVRGGVLDKILDRLKSIDDVPSDKTLYVEYRVAPFQRGIIVIHSCAGDKVNRTLGVLLFRLFLEKTNIPVVEYSSDPYRIYILLYPTVISGEEVRRAVLTVFRKLREIRERGDLVGFIKDALRRNLKILAWYFSLSLIHI